MATPTDTPTDLQRTTDNGPGTLLSAQNLTKLFCSGSEEVLVLDDLSVEVQAGEFVALVANQVLARRHYCIYWLRWTPRQGVRYTLGEDD